MQELWKPIPNYEGYYEASTLGRIRSVERTVVLKDRLGNDRPCIFKSKILKPYSKSGKRNAKPRYQIVLSKNGKTLSKDVHKLIALTFIPNPNNLETVNHIDGNPLNNSVANLEWCTKEENNRHAFKNNLIHTMKPVAMIDATTKEIIKVFPSEAEACRRIGVQQGKIRFSIQKGWKKHGYYWRYFDTENEPATTIEKWIG